ncbi:MAG: TetR family transcriptional regulator [Natronospirillum sp.]
MKSFIEEARHKQIVGAAIAVLAREGYARATLSRIAKEAGISKSIITYHFSGKDEMFEAVYRHVENSAGAYITPHMEVEADPSGMIAAYIRNQIGYMKDHRDELLAIGHLAMSHGGENGPEYIAASAREEITLLDALMATGQKRGIFRDFDRRVMAAAISKAIESALTEWAWQPETDLDAYGEELVALFLRGMERRNDD